MDKNSSADREPALIPLLALSARVGCDPLLTQGSTGNASVKLDRFLWIKASGKWMVDASREDILVPVELADVRACVRENVDPTERYSTASVETAMHAVLPHRVVLHVHCVDTIAWAVRQDAPVQLEHLLHGLRWQWVPYVPSGLALAREIQRILSISGPVDVLILGNHGLVLGGDDCGAVEALLSDVRRRLTIGPRQARPADDEGLSELADRLAWELPGDQQVHTLATDAVSRSILSGGLLYPCQAIFSNSSEPAALFRSVPYADCMQHAGSRLCTRPFLLIEDRGLLLNPATTAAQRAMISGLAHVVRRISGSAPVRYLTEAEVPNRFSAMACRYRDRSNASHGAGLR